MAENDVITEVRPNILAALPGRMVDEAPKRRFGDSGARRSKLIPSLFGILGLLVVSVALFMTNALSLLLNTEGTIRTLLLILFMIPPFIGAILGFGGYTFLNLRTRKYTLYRDRVEMKEGFLKHEAKTLPYSRVTNVQLSKNVWERWLGAGTVKLQTAGSDDEELWIRGINNPDKVSESIRQLSQGAGSQQSDFQ